MFFDNDHPYKGTRPADLNGARYSDPLGDAVCAFVWTFIVALVAYLTWAYKAGMLPVWG